MAIKIFKYYYSLYSLIFIKHFIAWNQVIKKRPLHFYLNKFLFKSLHTWCLWCKKKNVRYIQFMAIKEINKSVHIKEFYNLAIIRNKQNCGIIVTSIGMFLSFLLFSSSFSFFPYFLINSQHATLYHASKPHIFQVVA